LTKQLIEGKGPQNQKENSKRVTDFKVRALDFLSIYVKEKSYQSNGTTQIMLIRGLQKALSVAHKDGNKIMFERTKSVLTLMAK